MDLLFQVIWGEAERAGAVYAGEEKVAGGPYRCVQIPDGGSEEEGARLFSAVPRDQAVGLLKCKKFHLNVRNVFFHCEGDQTEKQVVESPSSETFETPLLVTQPAVGDPALSRGLDQMNSGGACQLQSSCGKKNTAVWSGGGAKPANFCSLLK